MNKKDYECFTTLQVLNNWSQHCFIAEAFGIFWFVCITCRLSSSQTYYAWVQFIWDPAILFHKMVKIFMSTEGFHTSSRYQGVVKVNEHYIFSYCLYIISSISTYFKPWILISLQNIMTAWVIVKWLYIINVFV